MKVTEIALVEDRSSKVVDAEVSQCLASNAA